MFGLFFTEKIPIGWNWNAIHNEPNLKPILIISTQQDESHAFLDPCVEFFYPDGIPFCHIEITGRTCS